MRRKKFYLATSMFVVCGIVFYFKSTNSFTFRFHYKPERKELQNYSSNETTSESTDISSLLQDASQRAIEQLKSPTTSSNSIRSIETLEYTYKCCNPNKMNPYRKSILYLKLHKCASSTLQNILMRFGLCYKLNFMLPKGHHTVIAYYQPYRDDMLQNYSRTWNGKYDILTHHIKYSPDIKNVLPRGTVSVTMMRSVPSLFESIYNFYGAPLKTGKCLQDYLKNPVDLNVLDTGAAHGLNQMSMDLGFERKDFQNETAIASFIKFIDNQFDLVMIVEYIEESFVLLAHLMGWPLDHVSYLSSNRRKNAGIEYQLTESDKEKIKQLNKVDTLLYDHFLKKFQKCRQQFGIERLQNEVKKLQALNQALKEKCVASEQIRESKQMVNLTIYQSKNLTDWECIYSTMYSANFTEELKIRQIQRLHPSTSANHPLLWQKRNDVCPLRPNS